MQTTITVRLSEKEAQALQTVCELTGKSRSEAVRDAIRAYEIDNLMKKIRADLVPRAEAIGWLTDEDVFRDVS